MGEGGWEPVEGWGEGAGLDGGKPERAAACVLTIRRRMLTTVLMMGMFMGMLERARCFPPLSPRSASEGLRLPQHAPSLNVRPDGVSKGGLPKPGRKEGRGG